MRFLEQERRAIDCRRAGEDQADRRSLHGCASRPAGSRISGSRTQAKRINNHQGAALRGGFRRARRRAARASGRTASQAGRVALA